MQKRGLWRGQLALAILLLVITLVVLRYDPSLTGLTVYDSSFTGLTADDQILAEKEWDFADFWDYSYDQSLLAVEKNKVELIQQEVITTWTEVEEIELSLQEAVLHNSGELQIKTNKVSSLDGEFVNLQSGNLLDIQFGDLLSDGDVVSLYLKQGNNVQAEVYLCDAEVLCEYPGYGSFEFSEEEGWYNITFSNLEQPSDSFSINILDDLDDHPDHIKIDLVSVDHYSIEEYQNQSLVYPNSAEIITMDFFPADLLQWQSFSSENQLNGQNIQYHYSLDSGINWIEIPEEIDLSSVEIEPNNGISLKAVLNSDGLDTPVLSKMALSYLVDGSAGNESEDAGNESEEGDNESEYDENDSEYAGNESEDAGNDSCVENWTVNYGECLVNNSKLKYYLDVNECGSSSDELENNIHVDCDYCNLNNCSSSYDDFIYYGEQMQVVSNDNSSLSLEINSSADDVNFSVETDESYLSVIEYSYNLKDISPDAVSLNKYFKIESENNFSDVKMIVSYNDEDITVDDLDEDTLKIYYYNESSNLWEALDSVVDADENFVYAIVDHFSYYGLFGQKNVESLNSPVSSSGGGSSGGGWSSGSSRINTVKTTEAVSAVTDTLKVKTINNEETSLSSVSTETKCNYIVEVDLPEEISFEEKDDFNGEITNKGNCLFQKLELSLSPEFNGLIDLPVTQVASLDSGNSSGFTIIRTQKSQEQGWFSVLTSSIVKEIKYPSTINGNLIIKIVSDGEVVFAEELPLQIKIIEAQEEVNVPVVSSAGSFFLLMVTLGIFLAIKIFFKKINNNKPDNKSRKIIKNNIPLN